MEERESTRSAKVSSENFEQFTVSFQVRVDGEGVLAVKVNAIGECMPGMMGQTSHSMVMFLDLTQ